MRGLASYAVYVPWRRLDRKSIAASHAWFAPALRSLAKGERAIAQWDEDAITMGVEAARGCVVDPETDAAISLTLSSTSLPYIDRQNAGVIKEALRLSDAISTSDLTGSRRAGTSALLQALDRSGEALCISAEKARPQPMSDTELLLGDGAAAFRVSDRDVIAELVGSVSISADFVDHFQPVDQPSYQWESRWIRDEGYGKIVPQAFDALSKKTGVAAGEITHFAFDAPTPGTQRRVARALGLQDEAASPCLSAEIGFTSAAHPLLMLADALERAAPGELILVVAFGQGCDMLLFRATDRIRGYRSRSSVGDVVRRRRSTDNYLRYLVLNRMLDADLGMRSEQDRKTPLTALYRDRKSVYGLVGGRCTKTGAIQFPKSDVSVSQNDWTVGTQEDYPLADLLAKIVTFTEDYLAYTPDPPYAYGTIEFEGGGRMVAEFADYELGALKVGADVRMQFRIKTVDANRGFASYFWKAVPIPTESSEEVADA